MVRDHAELQTSTWLWFAMIVWRDPAQPTHLLGPFQDQETAEQQAHWPLAGEGTTMVLRVPATIMCQMTHPTYPSSNVPDDGTPAVAPRPAPATP